MSKRRIPIVPVSAAIAEAAGQPSLTPHPADGGAAPARRSAPAAPGGIEPLSPATAPGALLDRLGRPLRDLRISVTDRCNFRCTYCMPREQFGPDHEFMPHSELLSFEEISRVAALFVKLGVRSIRLTGGEPLLRRGVEKLVEMLAALRTPEGEPVEIAMTTNGSVLARKAAALKAAGLARVTVSLDALDDAVFRAMNDADWPVADVLAGIDAAAAAGLGPVKINMVVKRGTNDDQIVPMARHFRGSGHTLRFIEFMDVGATNGWRMDHVVPSTEVIRRIDAVFPLEPIGRDDPAAPAENWRYRDGAGEVGVISSVTRAFCADCTRARLATDGRVFHCLFASDGHDLRWPLRNGADDDQLTGMIAGAWWARADRYSQLRGEGGTRDGRVEMSFIGG
ncbi:GTP 3',8-cyclase MoaA [Derxia gummosa]|uniref:GTP 3',8-cyclase n=1 Tax=Derxia gummosa DSM 723 TaxID=1121388 RepID=A0A8B6XAK4_9BURK|nr:GTP 3',8-cyclase MoaA [Derxia gummosa]